jgi:hypothetical protein
MAQLKDNFIAIQVPVMVARNMQKLFDKIKRAESHLL